MADDTIRAFDWNFPKKMALAEFVRLYEPENRAQIIDMITNPDYVVGGVVAYVNFDAGDHWGERTFVTYGAATGRTLEALLADKPHYADAVAYCEKEPTDEATEEEGQA